MDTIKDRNGMDLRAAKILRRGSKNTQKNCTKKDHQDPDNHDGMITHLEPDILECEVKWALGSIFMNKASEGDGIPVEVSNPKRWCCESDALNIPAYLENSAMATGLEKVSFIPIPKKGNAKGAQTTAQLHSSHTLVK